MTIGAMVSFLAYLTLLDWPMLFILWILSRIDEFKISLNRLNKAFKLPEEKIVIHDVTNMISGNIIVDNLSFSYPKSNEEVLSNITIDLKMGETLGIIGTIGNGKTTLMNLFSKLYMVPRGKITIGGMDINDIPIEVLRNSICYNTQDNFLFSASLKENINLFKDNYEDEEIYESTKKTMIYDEISEMKDGIYTVIGEKVLYDLRVKLFKFIEKANLSFHDKTLSGELYVRVTSDTEAVYSF